MCIYRFMDDEGNECRVEELNEKLATLKAEKILPGIIKWFERIKPQRRKQETVGA